MHPWTCRPRPTCGELAKPSGGILGVIGAEASGTGVGGPSGAGLVAAEDRAELVGALAAVQQDEEREEPIR